MTMVHSTKLSAAAASAIQAMNALAFSLHRELAHESEGNLVFSPASIVKAMAMLLPGAHGRTEAELLKAFGVEALAAPLLGLIAEIDAETRKGSVELHLA